MKTHPFAYTFTIVLCSVVAVGSGWAADEPLPDNDALQRALVDELARSINLQMEDLEKPYFIQFDVDDGVVCQITAEYGAITDSRRERERRFSGRIRVGSAELDNTNFVDGDNPFLSFDFGGGGAGNSLPIEDDYVALRQAIWRAVDAGYKEAVETLTKKRAYMKDKNIAERANDFSPAPKVEQHEPTAVLRFDRAQWEESLKRVSGHFKQYGQVQESGAKLLVGAGNMYVVNSEGTRVRTADLGALLVVSAQVQADDGMRLSHGRSYAGATVADLPPVEQILADVDQLVAELTAAMKAPVIEQYTGPVLFDDVSAAQVFQTLLAGGLAGKPDPVGEQRRMFAAAESLDSKLGTRILPKTLQVWDDPTVAHHDGQYLLGCYRYDAEGVPAARVDLVANGKLDRLCLSRAPTKKLSGSNGHARRAVGGESIVPATACLFVKDDHGVSAADLKAALIAAAKDGGLEYGVRIKALRSAGMLSSPSDLISFAMRMQRSVMSGGGADSLGDPVIAYKVYVADGREEPFRGCEFGPTDVTKLKQIAAAGDTPVVYNYVGLGLGGATPPSTIIAPPVLFEELELAKIQQEHDKLPLLKAPAQR